MIIDLPNLQDILWNIKEYMTPLVSSFLPWVGLIIGISVFGIITKTIIDKIEDSVDWNDEPSKIFMGSGEYTHFLSTAGEGQSTLFLPNGFGGKETLGRVDRKIYSGKNVIEHKYIGTHAHKTVEHILAGRKNSDEKVSVQAIPKYKMAKYGNTYYKVPEDMYTGQ